MPKSPDWRETAELVGIFAILISLIFVVLQLRQEKELLELEMRNYMLETTTEINSTIIENVPGMDDHSEVYLSSFLSNLLT